MPSEHPKPDRCAASVTEKVGLEVHATDVDAPAELDLDEVADRDADDRWVFTDREIGQVALLRDDEQLTVDPDYTTVVDYLRSEFVVESLRLDPEYSLTDPVVITDSDPYVTNRDTELQGYCLRYPMDSGKCYVHGGASSGAPDGNVNAMTHGLQARRSNYYDALDDDEKTFVEAMVDSWLDNAPFDRANVAKVTELYRIAIDQHRLWRATDEYVDDGLVKEQVVDTDETGEPVYAEDENPANLPYDRLDRTLYKKLKQLGVLNTPEDKQAEATESLAKKLSGLGDD